MANTSPVYARIDAELKESAEEILSQLGVSPSSMIQMLYSQIVIRHGIPFDVTLNVKKPLAEGSLTREQFNAELWKGVDSMRAGRTVSTDDVEATFE